MVTRRETAAKSTRHMTTSQPSHTKNMQRILFIILESVKFSTTSVSYEHTLHRYEQPPVCGYETNVGMLWTNLQTEGRPSRSVVWGYLMSSGFSRCQFPTIRFMWRMEFHYYPSKGLIEIWILRGYKLVGDKSDCVYWWFTRLIK